jgi:hypothetical protein
VVKLIVTLWAVLVEARSKRPISLAAERISSKLGRSIQRAQQKRHACPSEEASEHLGRSVIPTEGKALNDGGSYGR